MERIFTCYNTLMLPDSLGEPPIKAHEVRVGEWEDVDVVVTHRIRKNQLQPPTFELKPVEGDKK